MIDAVVVTHGDAVQARRCVLGLRWSSVSVGRIVLVDTSANSSGAAVFPDPEPWLHVIERPDNPGYGSAANAGIAATQASYVLLANADIYVDCDAMRHLVDHAEITPDVACVGPDIRNLDGSRQDGAFRFPGVTQAFLDAWPVPELLRRGRLNGRIKIRGRPVEIDHPLGACMLLRRLAFDAIGGFSPDYWMYSEEIDLCWRFKDSGWRVMHVPAARAWHVGGASTRHLSSQMFAELYRSRARWYRTHASPLVAQLALVAIRWGFRMRALTGLRAGRPASDYRVALEALNTP